MLDVKSIPKAQLDSMVARSVWGYVVIIDTVTGESYIMGRDHVKMSIPEYSTDITTAYEIAEHLRQFGFTLQLKNQIRDGNSYWTACFTKAGDGKVYVPVEGDTLPESICRAAISAAYGTNVRNLR